MFHVGQLVVCVDDSPCDHHLEIAPLRHGYIYTIRSTYDYGAGGIGVRIAEFCLPVWDGMEETWRMERFRPVEENRLSIFRKMLAPAPRKEEVA